jgi:hypothetical protein
MKFTFSPLFPDATDEQKWQQLRNWRNRELAATDYTQLADAPGNKQAWAAYRQELRDLPDQTDDPTQVELPERPS